MPHNIRWVLVDEDSFWASYQLRKNFVPLRHVRAVPEVVFWVYNWNKYFWEWQSPVLEFKSLNKLWAPRCFTSSTTSIPFMSYTSTAPSATETWLTRRTVPRAASLSKSSALQNLGLGFLCRSSSLVSFALGVLVSNCLLWTNCVLRMSQKLLYLSETSCIQVSTAIVSKVSL